MYYRNTRRVSCITATLAALSWGCALAGSPPGALSLPATFTLPSPEVITQAEVSTRYGQLPLHFEANQGQTDKKVKFLSRGHEYSLFLTSTEAVLALSTPRTTPSAVQAPPGTDTLKSRPRETTVVRMALAGARPTSEVVGVDPLPGKSSYFLGKDPQQWHTDVPHYAKVQYRNVYPGIDLLYYGHQRQLEYDFIVAPGADPQAIRLRFTGAGRLTLDTQGNLLLHTPTGTITQHKPIIYQEINGKRNSMQDSTSYTLALRERAGVREG